MLLLMMMILLARLAGYCVYLSQILDCVCVCGKREKEREMEVAWNLRETVHLWEGRVCLSYILLV